jgi:hypothetical protein
MSTQQPYQQPKKSVVPPVKPSQQTPANKPAQQQQPVKPAPQPQQQQPKLS